MAVDVPPPKIAEASGAVLSQWQGSRSPRSDTTLVSGCVATPIPGWVEDMRPAIEARTTALAGAVAEKITGFPTHAGSDGDGRFILHAASNLNGPVIGYARTFIGFDDARVFTCFATCAGGREPLECLPLSTQARLEGSQPPPTPGALLRIVTWGVHHPRDAAFDAALVLSMGIVLAVVLRRRPRSSIAGPRSPS
jgi:hypothetical protein